MNQMNQASPVLRLHRLVWTALLAALVAVGALLQLSIGPVPFSMQPFFVLLQGYILGPVWGAASYGLYLLAGAVGLPVFAGGKAGVAHLMGPTGGYLIGFWVGAFVVGFARRPSEQLPWLRGVAFGLAAYVVFYGLGVVWLKHAIGVDWAKAAAIGVLPFLPGDAIKLMLAVWGVRHLQSRRVLPA